MGMSRALMMLGAGLSGYDAGKEEARKRARQDEDDAFRREQRDRQRTQWQRDDKSYEEAEAEKQAVKTAAAPVETAPVYPTGDDEGNAMPMTPDMQRFTAPGQPGVLTPEQAAEINSPASRMRRAAGAVRDPMKAAQLESSAAQAATVQRQLRAQEEADAAQRFDRDLTQSLQRGGWDGFTKFLSESKADGKGGEIKFSFKKEGENVTLYPVGPDGTALGSGMTVPDTDEGRAKVAFLFAKNTTPQQKLQHYASEAKAKTDRDDKAADNKRADDAEARRRVHEDRMYQQALKQTGAAERAASRAGRGADATQPGAVAWDAESDKRLYEHYTAKDEITGATKRDGNGVDFSKQVALGISARNGGDTLRAVAQAIDIDQRLQARAVARAEASGGKLTPEQALREERTAFLTATRNPQQPAPQPGAAPAPAALPAAQVAPTAEPAPPAPRRATPTVIDFNPGGGAQMRRAAAKDQIPALQEAVEQAKREVEEAKAKGPLFVARARDKLANAKVQLTQAQERAGV